MRARILEQMTLYHGHNIWPLSPLQNFKKLREIYTPEKFFDENCWHGKRTNASKAEEKLAKKKHLNALQEQKTHTMSGKAHDRELIKY